MKIQIVFAKVSSFFIQRSPIKKIALFVIPAAACIGFLAIGQVSPTPEPPPNIKSVDLTSDALHQTVSTDKTDITLALSTEWTSVRAQYNHGGGKEDANYTNTKEYLGYYDAAGCYRYEKDPTVPSGTPQADYRRFVRDATQPIAINRKCTNAFAGNFLNWATGSATDAIRIALTGGDRYIDTNELTILQRAVLSPAAYFETSAMWNNAYWPLKTLAATDAYYGAVPLAMRNIAASKEIHISNHFDGIYFGVDIKQKYWLTIKEPRPKIDRINLNQIPPTLYSLGTQSGLTSGESFFRARVQVCDSDNGVLKDTRPWGLCTQYPSGNFKPTGVLQKYADATRVAVFSYLVDNNAPSCEEALARQYGVLRAPMKYIGYKTYNEKGIENTPANGNPAAEWDAQTGIIKLNPLSGDSATSGLQTSGVLNYINKFGRTQVGQEGRYKHCDPAGELHYEALRYLQGLEPSPKAIEGLTGQGQVSSQVRENWTQNFPVYTTWSDPYPNTTNRENYSCLRSTVMVATEKFQADKAPLPINKNIDVGWSDKENNIPDINYWRGIAWAHEFNNTISYADGAGKLRSTFINGRKPVPDKNATLTEVTDWGQVKTPHDSYPDIAGTWASRLTGQAYWANTQDIRGTSWTQQTGKQRPGLRVQTYTFDLNSAGWSSWDSYWNHTHNNPLIATAKYGAFQTDPSNARRAAFNTFGNPHRSEDGTENGTPNDSVWQVLENRPTGWPKTYPANYFAASNDLLSVISHFDIMFFKATDPVRSIAGSAVQSKNLTSEGLTIYQGVFNSSDWSGDLVAIPVSLSGSTVSVGTDDSWSAAAMLGALVNPAATRNVYVGDSSGISFTATRFSAGVSNAHQQSLAAPPIDNYNGTLWEDRLKYILGDRSKEGGFFRARSSIMGDVVNSGVVYQGAPSSNISLDGYGAFREEYKARVPAVYVGANDGMFHAFHATNGNELFAYIPSWLVPRLSALTSQNYNQDHQSYADGTPALAEAKLNNGWATVLVSGTGKGGRGVFALDVTEPDKFNADKVLWEFTNEDDADLGNVVGRPQIMRVRTNLASANTPTYKYFAIVASGVNNYTPDPNNGRYSSSGFPAIFLLDLSKPRSDKWTHGTNYFKISFPPTDSTLNPSTPAGIVNFTTTLDDFGANALSQLYVGDLQGNMWHLNFNYWDSANWNLTKLSAYKTTDTVPKAKPMYVAKDASGKVQPLSTAPKRVTQTRAGQKLHFLLFGTGRYLSAEDKRDSSTQSEYMLFEKETITGYTTSDGVSFQAVNSGRDNLSPGTVNKTTGDVSVAAFTPGIVGGTATTPPTKGGFYFDFSTTGERRTSAATISGNKIVFNTLIPLITSGGCANGGTSSVYAIDYMTGNGTSVRSDVGLLGEAIVVGVGTAAHSGINSTGQRSKTVTSQVIQIGSKGVSLGGSAGTITDTTKVGRLSWRQINNYRQQLNRTEQIEQ